jgi:putative transposase
VVIDGAKALRAAVKKVFGELALVQRCTCTSGATSLTTCPKRSPRGSTASSPARCGTPIPSRAAATCSPWPPTSPTAGPTPPAACAKGSTRCSPSAGWVSDRLAASLTCTNAIESMISICRDTARHAKRWRDAKMVRRWVATGMLNAERSFRRIKGCKNMPILVAAPRAHTARVTPARHTEKVA